MLEINLAVDSHQLAPEENESSVFSIKNLAVNDPISGASVIDRFLAAMIAFL